MNRKYLIFMAGAVLATLPGLGVRLAAAAGGGHAPLAPPAMALVSGLAILGASFLLLWACEAAQADVSRSLALAVVALVAVLPEYSVDIYFTWQAGKHPESDYASYAVANMTGANRLLIGVAWVAIAAVFWLRFRRKVRIGGERRTELAFLGLATAYAFLIPVKGSLAWYDGAAFLGIYAWYMVIAGKAPCEGSEGEGPAELILRLPRASRRAATALLFAFSGLVIFLSAEPFCEGLISTGKILHVNEFILVQWLAPIASEAPEFIVALVFAWKGQAGLAMGSLLSSKLNQWTLLVGMIPGVFAVSHGSLAHPLPMGRFQMHEILLTAAQSLLGVVLLSSLRLSLAGGCLLLGLFSAQLVFPVFAQAHPGWFLLSTEQMHPVFSALYVTAACAIFLQSPRNVLRLFEGLRAGGTRAPAAPAPGAEECCGGAEEADAGSPRTPECRSCRWRLEGLGAAGKNGEPAAGNGGAPLATHGPRSASPAAGGRER